MPVPVAPGRLPLLGHTLAMLRRRHQFTASLGHHGDIVRVDLGAMRTYFVTNPQLVHELLTTKGSSFRKGALFDKFLPFFGNGLATSNGAFVPFGAGARQCVGNLFAQTEIVVTVATMAARWRLVPVPASPFASRSRPPPTPKGLLMTAVPRNRVGGSSP